VTAIAVPGSGAEAIAAARDFAASIADGVIERDRAGKVPVRGGWAEQAGDDPYTISQFGRLAVSVAAAEALLAAAAATLDEVTRWPRDAAEAARGSIAVARAKAFASEVAAEVASDLFSLSGASAADERYDLSRHWRNARTHAAHDPVAWKYHHIGNFLLNDVLPPNHGQL
jgi:alkylation response protein AidB-like acyl-CoA dehydrogenase